MNLANKLTLLRIFLVPIFLVFIALRDMPYGTFIATAIFVLASLTDKLDGYIARSRNQITRFGKIMDPLADKLLVTAALVSLVEFQIIPSWAAVIIIAREFAVSGLRTVAASEGVVIAASYWGKLKTVIQICSIILLLLKFNIEAIEKWGQYVSNSEFLSKFFDVIPEISLYVAVIITLISGIDYFIKSKEIIKIDK